MKLVRNILLHSLHSVTSIKYFIAKLHYPSKQQDNNIGGGHLVYLMHRHGTLKILYSTLNAFSLVSIHYNSFLGKTWYNGRTGLTIPADRKKINIIDLKRDRKRDAFEWYNMLISFFKYSARDIPMGWVCHNLALLSVLYTHGVLLLQ